MWLALSAAAPAQNLQRLTRTAMIAAGVPVLFGARLADRMIAPIGRRVGLPNAYRILARKH